MAMIQSPDQLIEGRLYRLESGTGMVVYGAFRHMRLLTGRIQLEFAVVEPSNGSAMVARGVRMRVFWRSVKSIKLMEEWS